MRNATLAAAIAMALPLPAAFAQETPASTDTLGEIIVTAQRRSENIQDVPISVSALQGERLSALFEGGGDIQVLAARVPSLYAESSNGRLAPRFYIRGLGNSDFDLAASQPVSIIVDEVVLENVILKSFPMFDLARVEVLRVGNVPNGEPVADVDVVEERVLRNLCFKRELMKRRVGHGVCAKHGGQCRV